MAYNYNKGPKDSDSEFLFIPSSCSFLFFLAGPAGALRFLQAGPTLDLPFLANYQINYYFRFAVIFLSFFLLLLNFPPRPKKVRLDKFKLLAIWIYIVILIIGSFFNPNSFIPIFLQAFGVIAWLMFGFVIRYMCKNREQAVANVVLGHILSNLIYAVITVFCLFYQYEENFNPFNGRLVGPFIGSTILVEIFLVSLIFGLMLLFNRRFIPSIPLIIVSIWAIFATAVRTASLISFALLLISLISSVPTLAE